MGAQKIIWAHTHHLWPAGVKGPLKVLEVLGVYDALSRYLSLIFKHSDTKWDTNHIVDQIEIRH